MWLLSGRACPPKLTHQESDCVIFKLHLSGGDGIVEQQRPLPDGADEAEPGQAEGLGNKAEDS